MITGKPPYVAEAEERECDVLLVMLFLIQAQAFPPTAFYSSHILLFLLTRRP
jgi:hypothetical protein